MPPVSKAAVTRPAPSTAIEAPVDWLPKPPASAPLTWTGAPKAVAPGARRATSIAPPLPTRLTATVPSAPTAIARTRSVGLPPVVGTSVSRAGVSKLAWPGRWTAT